MSHPVLYKEIAKLEAKNKALGKSLIIADNWRKEKNLELDALKKQMIYKDNIRLEYLEKMKSVQQSRDELLIWCNCIIEKHSEHFGKYFYTGFVGAIEKAEALKKEETK